MVNYTPAPDLLKQLASQTHAQLTGLELDRTGGSVAAFLNLYLPQPSFNQFSLERIRRNHYEIPI